MSYPGLQGYSAHYSSNTQNPTNGYGADRHLPSHSASVTSANALPQPSRSQYPEPHYYWQGNGQDQYGYSQGGWQPYSSEGWRGVQSQHESYDYRQQSRDNASSTAPSFSLHRTTSHTSAMSTPALHSLAYASGLESAGLQSNTRGSSSVSVGSAPQNSLPSQSRTVSPTQSASFSRYSRPKNAVPTVGQSRQHLQLSERTLSGPITAQNKIGETQTVASPTRRHASPASRAMGNQASTAHLSTRTQIVGRLKSPVLSRESLSSDRAPSGSQGHLRQSSLQSQQAQQTYHKDNSSTAQRPPEAPPTAAPTSQPNTINVSMASSQGYSQGSSHTSAAALPQLSYPYQEQNDSMPSFIDPSQVYNPFHQEYEKRRAAAEAEAEAEAREEARRKAEAEAEAKAKAQAEAEKKAAHARLVEGLAGSENVLSNKPDSSRAAESRPTPNTSQTRRLKTPRPENGTTVPSIPSQSQSHSIPTADKDATANSSDDGMAKEMKQMIERMREYKAKDPSLFQKLWDDLKKGSRDGNTENESPKLSYVEADKSMKTSTPISQAQTALTEYKATQPVRTAIVVENNPEGLPDLGRFPAQRRNRKRKADISDSTSTNYAFQPVPGLGVAPQNRAGVDSSTLRFLEPKEDLANSNVTVGPQAVRGGSQTGQPPQSKQSAPQSASSKQASPPASGGGTVWPLARRQALAEAATNILKSDAKNKDHNITIDMILSLLAQNPSYIELCEQLEKQGLTFHRGQFARALLKAVPDLNSTAPPPAKDTQQFSSAQGPPAAFLRRPPAVPLPSPQPGTPYDVHHGQGPLSASPAQNASSTPRSYHHPTPTPPKSLNGYPSPSVSTQIKSTVPAKRSGSHSKPRTSLPPPPPLPGSKAAMAKKSSFSDIVDLTLLSDQEDERPAKQPRLEDHDQVTPAIKETVERSPQELHDAAQGLSNTLQNFNQPRPTGSYSSNYPPPPPYPPWPPPQQYPPPYAYPQAMHVPHQPQHAQYPPLPPPPPPRPQDDSGGDQLLKMMLVEQKKGRTRAPIDVQARDLAKPINKAEALRKSYYNPKTIARDVLIAAGRHPTEQPLNSHLVKLLANFHIDLEADLTTFDWDAIDPGGPAPPKVQEVDIPAGPPKFKLRQRGIKGIQPQGMRLDELANVGNTAKPISAARATLARSSAHPSKPQPASSIKPHSQLRIINNLDTESETSVSGGAKNVTKASPSISTPQPSTNLSASQTRSASMEHRQYKPGAVYPSGKRRGRPAGSKNKHPSRSAFKAGKLDQAGGEASGPRLRNHSPPPVYNIFMCQWRDCDAKLHNLSTLRKHIEKVHTDELEDGGFHCLWDKCRTLAKDRETGEYEPEVTFLSSKHWMDHVEKDHLEPIAWELGEGPSAKVTDDQSLLKAKESLNDSSHRKITPTTKPRGPQDPLILPAGPIPIRAFNKAHGNTNDLQKAKEILRAVEAKKAKIPGLDRGGCTLVTEARRTRFQEEEGVAREVEVDY